MKAALLILILSGLLFAQTTEVNYEKTIELGDQVLGTEEVANFSMDNVYNLYLLDNNKNKVVILNQDGGVIRMIPEFANAEYYDEPVAVNLFSDGRIAVLDKGFKKVITVTNKGDMISSFGNVDGGISSFDNPIDMVIDAYDNFYILDAGKQQILKFNNKGLFRGAVAVVNPIAIASDIAQNIYLLFLVNEKFTVQIFNSELQMKERIELPGLLEPTDVAVNNFGEFYIVDPELGGVVKFDREGKILGSRIGLKSDSKGRGNFAEATRVACAYLDDQRDLLTIYDHEFNYIQTYKVKSDYPRKKLESPPLIFDIKYLNETPLSFKDYTDQGNKHYFVTGDETIEVFTDSVKTGEITSGQSYEFGEISAVASADNFIFVADRDEDQILALDADTKQLQFRIGSGGSEEGNFDRPTDLVIDGSGNIYAADYGNNRINIFSKQGLYTGKIELGDVYPVKLVIDSKGNIFILPESHDKILKYVSDTKELKTLDLSFIPQPFEITAITILDDDIIVIYDNEKGTAYLIKDDERFSQFLSRGESEKQILAVSSLAYDMQFGTIMVSSSENKVTKNFKVFLAPPVPSTLVLKVNDFGYTEISWKTAGRAAFFRAYRKTKDEKEYQLFAKINEPKLVIDEPQPQIYQYKIEAVSQDNLASPLSDFVTDEFSYYIYLKNSDPLEAIKKLSTLTHLNESAVENRMLTINRELVAKYKNQKNYAAVINVYSEMQKLRPNDLNLYLDKSNVYKQLLRFQEAIDELNSAKLIFTDNPLVYQQLARLTYLNKDYHGVISICNEALMKFSENETILVTQAEAFEKLGQNEKAIDIYKDLAFKKGEEDYYISAGKMLAAQGRVEEAHMLYLQAQNIGVAGPKIFAAMGEAYIIQEKYADAIFQLEKSVSIDSTTAEFQYLLGEANSKKRNIQSAIQYFQNAIRLDPTKAKYNLALGEALELLNQEKDALAAFEKAVELEPDNSTAQFKLGVNYLKQKKYDYACRYLARANKLLPDSEEIKDYLDKALKAREKFNAAREPIEFDKIVLDNIFPSLLNYYNKHSIGTVSIFNTKNEAFEDVKLEVSCPEIFSEDFEFTIPVLLPNDFSETLINAKLKDALLKTSQKGEKDYKVNFRIKYKKDNIYKGVNESKEIKVYQLNAISWSDKKHLAGFINPKNEHIRNFVTTEIISALSEEANNFSDIPKPISQSIMIWEYLNNLNLSYVQDPNGSYADLSQTDAIDYVQFPDQTLERKSGDCDDLVTLISTLYETVGIQTAYIDVPGHVFLAFNTMVPREGLDKAGLTVNKIVMYKNTAWIPIETTVIGKNSFIDAWDLGIARYNSTIKENQRLEIIPIDRAAETYPPIFYPGDKNELAFKPALEKVKTDVKNSLRKYVQMTKEAIEMELLSTIKKYPENTYALNKLALYYAKNKDYKSAKEYFIRVLAKEPENTTALINLGNIYLIEQDYSNAESRYYKAYTLDETNPGLLINMSRLFYAQGDLIKSKEFYDRAAEIDTEFTSRFDDLYNKFYN